MAWAQLDDDRRSRELSRRMSSRLEPPSPSMSGRPTVSCEIEATITRRLVDGDGKTVVDTLRLPAKLGADDPRAAIDSYLKELPSEEAAAVEAQLVEHPVVNTLLEDFRPKAFSEQLRARQVSTVEQFEEQHPRATRIFNQILDKVRLISLEDHAVFLYPLRWLQENANEEKVVAYFEKWKGVPGASRPRGNPMRDIVVYSIVAFIGVWVLASAHVRYFPEFFSDIITGEKVLIASFASSGVILFSANSSVLGQPRNVIGGHIVSAIVGMIVSIVMDTRFPYIQWPLAVSLAVFFMNLLEVLHPPAAGTAVVPVSHAVSVFFVLEVGSTAVVMVFIAVFLNNFTNHMYPQYWW